MLTFLYMTAHSIIAYCGDLQGLMSANSQELHRSIAWRRPEDSSMTIDCPAEGHQPNTKVNVYRNFVNTLPWFTSVREKIQHSSAGS